MTKQLHIFDNIRRYHYGWFNIALNTLYYTDIFEFVKKNFEYIRNFLGAMFMKLGTRVKELAKERGISVAQVERLADIKPKSISGFTF